MSVEMQDICTDLGINPSEVVNDFFLEEENETQDLNFNT
jgi:hypothetical protein